MLRTESPQARKVDTSLCQGEYPNGKGGADDAITLGACLGGSMVKLISKWFARKPQADGGSGSDAYDDLMKAAAVRARRRLAERLEVERDARREIEKRVAARR